MNARRCLAVAALGAVTGCSGHDAAPRLPASGTDVMCGPGSYIVGTACYALPPFSDATVEVSRDASVDHALADGAAGSGDGGASIEDGSEDREGGPEGGDAATDVTFDADGVADAGDGSIDDGSRALDGGVDRGEASADAASDGASGVGGASRDAWPDASEVAADSLPGDGLSMLDGEARADGDATADGRATAEGTADDAATADGSATTGD